MSEHNSLLCGGELHDSLFLILSQLSCTTPWQLYVSIHQVGLLICNKHDKLMVKMTILFFTVYNLQYLGGYIALFNLSTVSYYLYCLVIQCIVIVPTMQDAKEKNVGNCLFFILPPVEAGFNMYNYRLDSFFCV